MGTQGRLADLTELCDSCFFLLLRVERRSLINCAFLSLFLHLVHALDQVLHLEVFTVSHDLATTLLSFRVLYRGELHQSVAVSLAQHILVLVLDLRVSMFARLGYVLLSVLLELLDD